MDTVKTKMQAQTGYLESGSLKSTVSSIYRKEGIPGFYKGALSPLTGSIIFRAGQFSIFEGFYTYGEKVPTLQYKIPFTMGVELRVLMGGFMAGSFRTLVETPFEYVKIKRQTGQAWKLREVYKGIGAMYMRTSLLLTFCFTFIDSFRRNTRLSEIRGVNFMIGSLSTVISTNRIPS